MYIQYSSISNTKNHIIVEFKFTFLKELQNISKALL